MADRLTASRLISDHMMLQRRKPVHLWGKTEPERKVRALLAVDEDPAAKPVEAETVAQADGSWSLFLPAMEASEESRTLTITDSGDERIVVHDVLIGEVWFASGQSNMDLMLERVRDRYPVEASEAEDRCLRCFKIAEHTDYHEPLAEPLTGEWWCVSPETILAFSATGYFFAKHYRKMTGVPVGFIHASLGGSRIAGWMSREMLAAPSDLMPGGYPAYLADAEHYADDAFLAGQVKKNEQQAARWNAELEKREEQNKAGLLTKDSGDGHVSVQNEIIPVPCFFRDISELRGFIGKITLTKKFTITEEMLRKVADHARIRLFLGTMVDRDEVFVNGVKVGETGYQYPPRKYDVPLSALHPGENEVEIRLVVETGQGRLTPGKKYAIFCEDINAKTERDTDGREIREDSVIYWDVDLSGEWAYRILACMDAPIPPTDFVNWHPTGLFNGMAAPCVFYTIGGFLWYQGEANADFVRLSEEESSKEAPLEDYEDLQRRLMRGWRKLWHTHSEQATDAETLPFLYVQLPNFEVDLDETGIKQWAVIRDKQRACLSEPRSGMVEAMGLGCDNDLHPHEKEPIGQKLAELAVGFKEK